MTGMIMLLLLFLIGLALNALFAGYETGFIACNRIRVRHLAQKEQVPNALRLLAYLGKPDRMLTVVLIGTNLALIMGTVAIARLLDDPLLTMLIATPLFLIFGEVLPKSIFRLHPTRLALRLIPVIRFFDALLLPMSLPVVWLSQKLLLLVPEENRTAAGGIMQTAEEMRIFVEESADKGTIEDEEKEMIYSVIDLQVQQAKEIMVPRIDIIGIPESGTRDELTALLIACGRTRILVYRENMDYIVGAINAFDVLCDQTPEDQQIVRFIKPILHVHDTMRLDDLLRLLRQEKQSMAIVTDEYGGTDGLVSIEDILEEIFGEIRDEYDSEESMLKKVGPNAYVIQARMPLEDLVEALELNITDEDVETVGGWMMHLFARIPHRGEVIEHNGFRFTVLEGGPNHIASLRLELLNGAQRADIEEV